MQAILVNVGVTMRCRDFGGRIIVYVLLFWSIIFNEFFKREVCVVVVKRFRPAIRVISQIYSPKNKGEGLNQSGATDIIDKTGLTISAKGRKRKCCTCT